MMEAVSVNGRGGPNFQGSWAPAILWLLSIAGLAYAFRDAFIFMSEDWNRPEYSHGYLIPVVVLVLVLQRWDELLSLKPSARWFGPLLLMASVALLVLGEFSTLYVVIQYGGLLALYGLFVSAFGLNAAVKFIGPLALLIFMVPLPEFIYQKISIILQNVSSQLGVWIIRQFGISVFIEGNIIDLGVYKLAVVEACSGLRYMFPLMSFGFICAYLFRANFMIRLIVFLTTVPIAILLNGLRIGINGVLIEYFGIAIGEGFLHYFEGWVIFLICVLMLLGEIWAINRFILRGEPLSSALRLDFAIKRPDTNAHKAATESRSRIWISATVVAISVLAIGAAVKAESRTEAEIARESLDEFPMRMESWRGMPGSLSAQIESSLGVTDYVLADYVSPGTASFVNLYIAFYESQRKGDAAHSPQSCIPGGGWEIIELGTRDLDAVVPGELFRVNRAVIQKGTIRQVVYYWFQQRGRHLTNEYMVKWYLFWDGLTRNRTDGALVRLISPIKDGESEEVVDRRITKFARMLESRVGHFVPD